MTSNPAPMVQPLPNAFQNLLADVTGPEARLQTAYPVEVTLCRRLLPLGAALVLGHRRRWAPGGAGHRP